MMNLIIGELWYSTNQDDWILSEACYWKKVSDTNISLEKSLEEINPDDIKQMSSEAFYIFLHDTYFVWKYTAKNRLATTRAQLKRHLTDISALTEVQKELFSFDKAQIRTGLEIASKIRGLGISGASGLLSVLFPDYFGTVDQFLVKSLLCIEELKERKSLTQMRLEALTLSDGVVLEQILRAKASELNRIFQTDTWTPRKIDKILWAYREKEENPSHIYKNPTDTGEHYMEEELHEALRAIYSTISKCEKVLPKLHDGTPQHTLTVRRIKALQIAVTLISRELENVYGKETPKIVG